MGLLGRRVPPDFEHVERYALSEIGLPVPPAVEKSLGLPWWWKQHIQYRSDCVGHGESASASVTNHYQRLRATGQDVTYRYDSRWLYDEALKIDEWPGEADEGTSLRAGYEVLRIQGHRRVQRGVSGSPVLEHGISTYRWAQSIDEIRAAIYAGLAVAIGIEWYAAFDAPYQKVPGGEYWIDFAQGSRVLGGHCTCLYRMSDRRQAFAMWNSWENYPWVWLPYDVLGTLLGQNGEAGVITDR